VTRLLLTASAALRRHRLVIVIGADLWLVLWWIGADAWR